MTVSDMKNERYNNFRFCTLFLIAVIFSCFVINTRLHSQSKPARSGKYEINITLPEDYHGKKIKDGDQIYIIKERWGEQKGEIIDSAKVIEGKVRFKGNIFALEYGFNLPNIFTAGEYRVKFASYTLFRFFYSNSSGGNFKENFTALKSENKYIQEFARVAPKRDLYGMENKLYLDYQNFQNLLALLKARDLNAGKAAEEHIGKIADSLSQLPTRLNFIGEKECPASLFAILIKKATQRVINEKDTTLPQLLVDDRLYFTRFGKEIFEQELEKLSLLPREKGIAETFKLLDGRYLTQTALKTQMVLEAYKYFKESNVMGSETIAIAIAKKYILSKQIETTQNELFEADYYVSLNENTLLDKLAPTLELPDTLGQKHSLDETFGYYTILYFYTDDCSYCAIETPKLISFLNDYSESPINLCTIYIGNSREKWKEYITNFSLLNPFVNRIDIADIEKDSDALLRYGIVSTPTMFLLDKKGMIIGRKIKTETIRELLANENSNLKRLHSYFGQIFKSNEEEVVKKSIDYFAGDTSTQYYTDLLSELYVFLSNSPIYANQLGALYLAENYILPNGELWHSASYIESIGKAAALFKLNMLGTKANDVKLYDAGGMPRNLLQETRKKKILLFYKPNCGICNESIAELKKIYDKEPEKYIITTVYIGKDEREFLQFVVKNNLEWINLWDKNGEGELHKKYELELTPQIYLLDEDNIVIAKDITIYDLKAIIGDSE